jgi:hypothetical protein
LKTPHNYIAGRFQKAVRVRTPYRRKIPERTLLGEKSFLREATEKKEQKIKPENYSMSQTFCNSFSDFGRDFRQASFLRERFSAGGLVLLQSKKGKGESIDSPYNTTNRPCPKEATTHRTKISISGAFNFCENET